MSSHYPTVFAIIASLFLLYAQFTPSTSQLSEFLKQSITFEQIVLRFREIRNIFLKVPFTPTKLDYPLKKKNTFQCHLT